MEELLHISNVVGSWNSFNLIHLSEARGVNKHAPVYDNVLTPLATVWKSLSSGIKELFLLILLGFAAFILIWVVLRRFVMPKPKSERGVENMKLIS